MSDYFPEPKTLGERVKVELNLSNYIKNAAGIDTASFAKKSDLKSDVDKLDIDKLKSVPTNLSKLQSKVDKLDILMMIN